MTPAQQHARWGVAVETTDDGEVLLQVGTELRVISAEDAQHFAYYLARAYVRGLDLNRRSAAA